LTNRRYEGSISGAGDSVKIQSFSDITISPYTKNSTVVSPEILTDSSVILPIDQANQFAFLVDDVDKAQMNVSIMQDAMQNAAYGLRNTVDARIAGFYGDAGSKVGSAGSPIDVNSTNVIDNVLAMGEALNDNNVALENRWLVVNPWFMTKLTLAGIGNETNNGDTFKNGYIFNALGFNIYLSNNVHQATPATGAGTAIMAGSLEAIAYAEQINSVEAFRPEAKYADAIKGLHVSGSKVIKANELVCLFADKTAEE